MAAKDTRKFIRMDIDVKLYYTWGETVKGGGKKIIFCIFSFLISSYFDVVTVALFIRTHHTTDI